jgi:tRNA G46 methylase TrmB
MKKSNNPYLIRSNQKDIHESLEKIVTKHLNTEFMRPTPEHQIEIFNIIDDIITKEQKPIILDSGCGTGLSTQNLAKQFPNHLVIGIDRSLHRLNKADLKEPAEFIDFYKSIRATCFALLPGLLRRSLAMTAAGTLICFLCIKKELNKNLNHQRNDSPHPERSPSAKEWFLSYFAIISSKITNFFFFWQLIETSYNSNISKKSKNTTPYIFRKDNLILVQANLIDFWNLIYQKNQSYLDSPNKPNSNKSNSNKSNSNKSNSNKKWNITHHFILYPNPYPKAAQFKQRFHGHPIFPIMLKISPRLEIRTNWEIYIKEAHQSIKICNKDLDNNLKINIENINNDFNNKNSHPISLFEDKYLKNNIKIYKLNFIKKPLK